MHEASLVAELLTVVERQARSHGLIKVTALKLRVGAMRAVDPSLLQSAFEVMREETIAAGAQLTIESVPLIARCDRCAKDVPVQDFVFLCPECGAVLERILTGKELDLLELTGEEGGQP